LKTRKEILERLAELRPELELAEDSYFSVVESKQRGEDVDAMEFLKIESEYELIKKEFDTLQWVIKINSREEEGDESSLSYQEG